MERTDTLAEITFQYKKLEGIHCISSQAVPGLLLASGILDKALEDLPLAVAVLLSSNSGRRCKLSPALVWEAFEHAERRARNHDAFRFTVRLSQDGGGGDEIGRVRSRVPEMHVEF